MENTNNVTEFILLGLSQNEQVQQACFLLFLLIYLVIVLGNLLIMVTVKSSQRLHTPMYYFLSVLSFVDICYASATVPKLIADLLAEKKSISFQGCITQLFSVHIFGCIEILILTVMAYDRYVAICKPLHYTAIMSRQVCHQLMIATWLGGLVHSMVQTILTIKLPFCGPNEIDHYFCDVYPLLKLACSDTRIVGALVVANTGMIILGCFLVLVVSYAVILITLRTQSSEGRRKALSTCASHITVVLLLFGSSLFIYIRPSTTLAVDKVFSLFYTILTPMLNPIIYTLRNAEMKNAMKKLWSRTKRLGEPK
ncbi:olfactory receptor 4S2-like [Rhineura floridana]|uniref:olfactory receptor 4S2-like n=1 Tax=Rhineura floridana TaxID=261503 RepID=UPI002AC81027|nr:olfactory receptor 4S2-like [Rhineura floridana]